MNDMFKNVLECIVTWEGGSFLDSIDAHDEMNAIVTNLK